MLECCGTRRRSSKGVEGGKDDAARLVQSIGGGAAAVGLRTACGARVSLRRDCGPVSCDAHPEGWWPASRCTLAAVSCPVGRGAPGAPGAPGSPGAGGPGAGGATAPAEACWHVLVADDMLKAEEPVESRLSLLAADLAAVSRALPPDVAVLVADACHVFVHDSTRRGGAETHWSAKRLRLAAPAAPTGPRRFSVEINSWSSYVGDCLPRASCLAHELSHVYHALLGREHAGVDALYQAGLSSGKYERVAVTHGTSPRRAYGLQNACEFFASLSVPLLGFGNDFQPFSRAELEAFDPESLRALVSLWGELSREDTAAWFDAPPLELGARAGQGRKARRRPLAALDDEHKSSGESKSARALASGESKVDSSKGVEGGKDDAARLVQSIGGGAAAVGLRTACGARVSLRRDCGPVSCDAHPEGWWPASRCTLAAVSCPVGRGAPGAPGAPGSPGAGGPGAGGATAPAEACWHVLVADDMLKAEEPVESRLSLLAADLAAVSRALPPDVAVLVADACHVFVHDSTRRGGAETHWSAKRLRLAAPAAPTGPRRFSVEINSWSSYVGDCLPRASCLAHELSHVYHALLGREHAGVDALYQAGLSSGKYERVAVTHGTSPRRAYGLQNACEFFASLSVPLLGFGNDFQPFSRAELEAFDPESLRALVSLWGELSREDTAAWFDAPPLELGARAGQGRKARRRPLAALDDEHKSSGESKSARALASGESKVDSPRRAHESKLRGSPRRLSESKVGSPRRAFEGRLAASSSASAATASVKQGTSLGSKH